MSTEDNRNLDAAVVEAFGAEWRRFDQTQLSEQELREIFDGYFAIFPWDRLPDGAVGFDAGCGSGRWAALVAPRVGHLHCIDASDAIGIAKRRLAGQENCSFHRATIDEMPFPDASMDFGYSLGVLHHLPDTGLGLAACVRKLKPGAPFLVYLYYAFDQRPAWFRILWRASDLARRAIARLPELARTLTADTIAALVYWPLARTARALEIAGLHVEGLPLSAYRRRSFYTMRTDALDRFGTRLERRFSRDEMRRLMVDAGLRDICVSPDSPFWCAVGYRA